jgi:hypothetical protein
MRKVLIVLSCLVGFIFANFDGGFENIKWGESPDKLPKYEVYDEGYDYPTKDLFKYQGAIDGITAEYMHYHFFEDKFYMLQIEYDNKDANYDKLRAHIETLYGKFTEKNQICEGISKGYTIETKMLTIETCYDGRAKQGTFHIKNNKLSAETEKREKKLTKKTT